MASGRNMQLTKQIGENLVVAELGRRKFIATTFAGNVPAFDILAAGENGKTFPLQVKAIQGASWQFDIRTFLQVELVGDTQIVLGKNTATSGKLICVFVKITEGGEDEFYLFYWSFLQDYFLRTYKGGKRPRNPGSFHCAIWPKDLQLFKNNWRILP